MAAQLITLLNSHFQRSGAPCRAETPSPIRITARRDTVRGPDVVIRCGSTPRTADLPVAVFEVMSPANSSRLMEDKERDYRSVDSIRHIVRLAQDDWFVTTLRRAGDLWIKDSVSGPEGLLRLESLEFQSTLAELYLTVLDPNAETGTV